MCLLYIQALSGRIEAVIFQAPSPSHHQHMHESILCNNALSHSSKAWFLQIAAPHVQWCPPAIGVGADASPVSERKFLIILHAGTGEAHRKKHIASIE